MTEQQAFLIQASSDYRVFRILLNLDRATVPACHALHYLQMSTEKLAKAAMKALERPTGKLTHVAFSDMPYLLARTEIAKQLGWQNAKAFRQFLKKSAPIFRKIEELNPSVGTQHVIASSREQYRVHADVASRR